MPAGVIVKMTNGDNETFKTATSFAMDRSLRMNTAGDAGWLHVLQGDAELGVFPPGSWSGVRYFEGHTPTAPKTSTQTLGSLGGSFSVGPNQTQTFTA